MNSSLNKEVVFFGKPCLEIYIIAKVKVTKKTRIYIFVVSANKLTQRTSWINISFFKSLTDRNLCQACVSKERVTFLL